MIFRKICVLGLGYIGLPTASTFATHGLQVLGVDVNINIVNGLHQGKIHIHEPGLAEVVTEALASGNLSAATVVEPADGFVIAVPTPFLPDKTADMQAVKSAAQSIVPVLQPGNLVVLESTSPPRTTCDIVAPILEQSGLKAGIDFYLCYSPERVLPGKIMTELVHNARVMGGITPASASAGYDLYRTFVKGEIVLTDATTAEMVKLMENTFRDINIAIANEFSRLADRVGIDVWEAIQIANMHPRIHFLNPGPGVGGHCISVDPWFLVETAPDIARLIRTAREVNDWQPHYVVNMVARAVGGSIAGKQMAVLGLAYKADVDDLRESPAIEICHLLHAAGAAVTGYEPYKPNAAIPGLSMVGSLAEAVDDADVILLLVGHQQFHGITPELLRSMTSAKVIVDTVNLLTGSAWEDAGFTVHRLGVGQGRGANQG